MSKLGLFAAITTLLGALTLAVTSQPVAADDVTPCVAKEFKTEMVKNACAKGGQKAAKDAMKAFMKEKKIKSCNACHEKLAPSYEQKKDSLDQFQKAGGK